MDNQLLAQTWQKAWTEGLWHAQWSKAVADLSPEQASWKPQPQRHSIWQIVNHIIFWREYLLRSASGDRPNEAEVERRNFEEPGEPTETVWAVTVQRLTETQEKFREAFQSDKLNFDHFADMLAHDSYHMGQIMYLRALQGLPPVG